MTQAQEVLRLERREVIPPRPEFSAGSITRVTTLRIFDDRSVMKRVILTSEGKTAFWGPWQKLGGVLRHSPADLCELLPEYKAIPFEEKKHEIPRSS
jgi:hypothetical protein